MIRLFLRLFLLILVSFLLFTYLGLNPINWVRSQQSESYVTEQLKGVRHHLISTLQPLTPEQRQRWIHVNNRHFNYRLALGNAKDFYLTRYRDRLNNNEAILKFSSLHMPFPEDEQILRMRIFESNAEGYSQSARGGVWLLQETLATYDDMNEGLRSIQTFFVYPVNALKADQVDLSNDQWHQLREDDLIVIRAKGGTTHMIYSQYETPKHGAWIIRAGPIDESAVRQDIILLGMLGTAFVLLVPVLLWLLWFWFDLRKFQHTSRHFGRGKLNTRLTLKKGSALYLPSQSFNKMADDLQKLIEGHKTLVNAVSHELKTPVARLQFALEILRDATNEEERNHSQAVLQRNIHELEENIQELLLYARYERSIILKLLDEEAIQQWLDEICLRFRSTHPKLTLRVNADLLPLRMDKRAMRHLLNNLLSNAAEHSRGQVLLKFTSVNNRFRISVEDDGDGVAKEWREKIFEPFSRPDVSRQRATGGRGLGLAIVWQITVQHGGDIVCGESGALGGANFMITWPALN